MLCKTVVAAVLLATSSQFLLTAMTPYSMTAHLALNLAWLWLFLRGGVVGHSLAIAVGALACGLHQLVFHPLFVAPFALLSPCAGVVASVVVLGEGFGALRFSGMALILAGLAVILLPTRREVSVESKADTAADANRRAS